MLDYILKVKEGFRDQYGFRPNAIINGEPCFPFIPDGDYPMKIDGKTDRVKLVNGKISCCNFDKDGK